MEDVHGSSDVRNIIEQFIVLGSPFRLSDSAVAELGCALNKAPQSCGSWHGREVQSCKGGMR